jgi:hypothetical protein
LRPKAACEATATTGPTVLASGPLAIPLLGTRGLLAFLVPERGHIALVGVAMLALALLLLRLWASTTCAVNVTPAPAAA